MKVCVRIEIRTHTKKQNTHAHTTHLLAFAVKNRPCSGLRNRILRAPDTRTVRITSLRAAMQVILARLRAILHLSRHGARTRLSIARSHVYLTRQPFGVGIVVLFRWREIKGVPYIAEAHEGVECPR